MTTTYGETPSMRAIRQAAEANGWTWIPNQPGSITCGLRKGRRTGWVQVSALGGFVRGGVSLPNGSGLSAHRTADMICILARTR